MWTHPCVHFLSFFIVVICCIPFALAYCIVSIKFYITNNQQFKKNENKQINFGRMYFRTRISIM